MKPRILKASLLSLAVLAGTLGCEGATAPRELRYEPPGPHVPASNEPSKIIVISGDDQQGRPGDRLQPIVVAVRDPSGRPVSGARVMFAVIAGDGSVGTMIVGPDGLDREARWNGPAPEVTNGDGEATVLWWLGRHGENTLLATVESEGKAPEVTSRATSLSSGYAGGAFALTSGGTSLTLNDGMAGGPYGCVVKSGSIVLSADGSFEGEGQFTCGNWPTFGINVIETGFYADSGSTIMLHYLKSNDTAGFFPPREVYGVMGEGTIAFSSYGVEWRYTKLK